ncbi:MAG: hypothetical protein HQL57_08060 [Magnetococcales bacterium]|nr:hypothetical protein [Magnetococcales bacterium]MBF0157121.1 hypothetical protein [Magnetococcales bacterium]
MESELLLWGYCCLGMSLVFPHAKDVHYGGCLKGSRSHFFQPARERNSVMVNIPRLIAMEALLERMAEELVSDIREGNIPMDSKVVDSIEAIVDAARKTQIVRMRMESLETIESQTYEFPARSSAYKLAS